MHIYYLQRFEVSSYPARGLMRVHLHGVGLGWRGRVIKHKEVVNLPLHEQEPVQLTIRRAVATSPHVWKVSLLKNLSVFEGKFYQPMSFMPAFPLQEDDKTTAIPYTTL